LQECLQISQTLLLIAKAGGSVFVHPRAGVMEGFLLNQEARRRWGRVVMISSLFRAVPIYEFCRAPTLVAASAFPPLGEKFQMCQFRGPSFFLLSFVAPFVDGYQGATVSCFLRLFRSFQTSAVATLRGGGGSSGLRPRASLPPCRCPHPGG